jgi:hypothetical protein
MTLKRPGQRAIDTLRTRPQPGIAIRPVTAAARSWWLDRPREGFTQAAGDEQERMQYGQHANAGRHRRV